MNIASVADKDGKKIVMKKPTFSFQAANDSQEEESNHLVNIFPQFIDEDAAKLFYHAFDYT